MKSSIIVDTEAGEGYIMTASRHINIPDLGSIDLVRLFCGSFYLSRPMGVCGKFPPVDESSQLIAVFILS